MAQVELTIGGRRYEMAVRDGQEAHFKRLASVVDEKARAVTGSMGNINEPRLLLMAALLLADEMGTKEASVAPAPAPAIPAELPPLIETMAERIERIATKLEKATARP